MESFLYQASIYLVMAVIAVPIAMRFGLGSVLGYLLTGILLGPALGLVGAEAQNLQNFAEFGIVMMLFLIGLDLEPRSLWDMRNQLLGMGGLQVLLSVLALMGLGMAFGLPWSVALAIGLMFALSSTAIVAQTLSEMGLMQTRWGRSALSVLLFQDIAVFPILALLPLLSVPLANPLNLDGSITRDFEDHGEALYHDALSLVDSLPAWGVTLVTIGAILAVVLLGKFLAGPAFRHIHTTRLQEMHIAFALLIVVGISFLMMLVGLSPALGSFLAGIVLANSSFRHDMAAAIEPFKGLLLGLFFITVGAGINFQLLMSELPTILSLVLGLIVVKFTVLWLIGKVFNLKQTESWFFALSLAQGGEFGFVLASFGAQQDVLPARLAETLILVIAVSMVFSPILFLLAQRLTGQSYDRSATDKLGKIKVFLSYSRLDEQRMLEVSKCLEAAGFAVFYDTRSLPFAEKWKAELRYLIEQADVVVWLISRSSIESYWCKWELEEISKLGKKLVPLSIAEYPQSALPEILEERQILPNTGCFGPKNQGHIDALVNVIGSDHAWVKFCTRLTGNPPEKWLC